MVEAILDMGICHYMVILKDADGSCMQWDFGPRGGDVHIDLPSCPLQRLQHQQQGGHTGEGQGAGKGPGRLLTVIFQSLIQVFGYCIGSVQLARIMAPLTCHADTVSAVASAGGVPGEIRETALPHLPPHLPAVRIGTTCLSPQQIQSFNRSQPLHYKLLHNDCRCDDACLHRSWGPFFLARFIGVLYHMQALRKQACEPHDRKRTRHSAFPSAAGGGVVQGGALCAKCAYQCQLQEVPPIHWLVM